MSGGAHVASSRPILELPERASDWYHDARRAGAGDGLAGAVRSARYVVTSAHRSNCRATPSWQGGPLRAMKKTEISALFARHRVELEDDTAEDLGARPTVPRRARTYPQRVSSPLSGSGASGSGEDSAPRPPSLERHVDRGYHSPSRLGEPRRRRRDHRQSTLYPRRGAVLDLLCCCWWPRRLARVSVTRLSNR